MHYKIDNPDISGIRSIKISGRTSILDILRLLLAGADLLMRHHSRKIIVDITEEEGKFNVMDTLELVKQYPQYLRKFKFAIVDKPENYDKLKTHESMALKRGFRMFGFIDKDSAADWLNGSTYNERERCKTKLCGIPNCTEADD